MPSLCFAEAMLPPPGHGRGEETRWHGHRSQYGTARMQGDGVWIEMGGEVAL